MVDGGRYRWLRRIEALDPVRDHHEIYRISVGYEFPFDYQRALELALLRTYCVPSISALLDATGEFRLRTQQRYDDTALLMAEMAEHGYDSPRGRQALRVVNRAHRRYAISNDDMRYVLSTFVYEPVDWLERFGWRRLHEHERLAAFHYYRAVGARMDVRDVPDDYDAFRDFKREYERASFRFAPTNQRIGAYTVDLFGSWYPRPPRRAARRARVASRRGTRRLRIPGRAALAVRSGRGRIAHPGSGGTADAAAHHEPVDPRAAQPHLPRLPPGVPARRPGVAATAARPRPDVAGPPGTATGRRAGA
ncbi:oxygenase MpaB family protein [Micromonospora sp. NBRC 101691]|uniref:oxygenase MpaB family protein n=1 Tax=Micromonospora sp. NBRC 101691 TaxID=3032198 RepID=UPI0024A50C5F|nr:oxygenase MpaB family protein [Micromonospora sp. NBRC 101691]GLY24693.1 hypothetical protein Misp04_44250 [Micromonospora sp. NBRC 101691]